MRAFMVQEENEVFTLGVRDREPTKKDVDDILVHVDYSGVNFKDALVGAPQSRVRRVSEVVGGVDAAGTVVESSVAAVAVGTRVAVHGGTMGVARDGGFAEFVYAPLRHLSVLPESISTRDAMVIGTAGFTAMQSVLALEDRGLASGSEVLVTGATGGVGSQSVIYLAARGYQPVASTGSLDETPWLEARGARRVIGRDEVTDNPGRVLGSELWDGAIDSVGGETLAMILRSLRYGAGVAACGLVRGAELNTTVYPFITRNVALLGIDCVEASAATRARVWSALGATRSTVDLDAIVDREVSLDGVAQALEDIRLGATRGRILVNPALD